MSNNAREVKQEPGVEWVVCTAEQPWVDLDEAGWKPRESPADGTPAPVVKTAHPDAVLQYRATWTGFYKCPHCPAGFIDDVERPDEGDEFTGQLFDMKGEF